MKKLTILLLFVCAFNGQLFAQEYDIYFTNFDTDLIQLKSAKQLDLGMGIGLTGTGNVVSQIGYSPIEHLSIAAGFFNQKGGGGADNSGFGTKEFRRAYTISVGTYYYLLNNQRDIFEEGTKIVDARKRRSLLLTAAVGFSWNEMENLGRENGGDFFKSDIDYRTLFLKLGIAYEHKWGMTTATMGFKNIEFTRAFYSGYRGSIYDLEKLSSITDQLREDPSFNIFTVGIHHQFGKRLAKLQIGGTLPVVYFQNFKNQAAEIDDSSIYLGCVIEINRLIKYMKFAKDGKH